MLPVQHSSAYAQSEYCYPTIQLIDLEGKRAAVLRSKTAVGSRRRHTHKHVPRKRGQRRCSRGRSKGGRETRDMDDGAGRISVADELATTRDRGGTGGNTALPRRGDGELPRWPSWGEGG